MDGNRVRALAVFDDGTGPALYAGGDFITATEVVVNCIARWDGRSWSPVAGGVSRSSYPSVYALVVYDDGTGPALYAAGIFDKAGGVTVNNVAKWDGRAWHPLSGGIPGGVVLGLAVFDDGSGPALYVAGGPVATGRREVVTNGIAKWDGDDWSPLGSGIGGRGGAGGPYVRALCVFDDGSGPALYAGGWFTIAGGMPANSIAKWDGKRWSPLGQGITGYPSYVMSLAVHDDGTGPALYVGGGFYYAGGIPVQSIAKWDGFSWSAVGPGLVAPAASMRVHNDGSAHRANLFVGGYFGDLGRVTRWDGAQWSRLGAGTDYAVLALDTFADPGSNLQDLHAGGEFRTAGGAPANHVAAWRGCVFADLDGDGDVDVSDFVIFQQCYGGSNMPPAGLCPDGVDADFDDDSDVDLADFLIFQQHFTGSR